MVYLLLMGLIGMVVEDYMFVIWKAITLLLQRFSYSFQRIYLHELDLSKRNVKQSEY